MVDFNRLSGSRSERQARREAPRRDRDDELVPALTRRPDVRREPVRRERDEEEDQRPSGYTVGRDGVRKQTEEESETLQERLIRLQRRIAEDKGVFFKPDDGLHTGRILPSWLGPPKPGKPQNPWHKECPNHYKVGPQGMTVTCLTFWDQRCLVCDKIDELSASDSARDQNLANAMRTQTGFIVNWALRNDSDGVIKVWNMNPNQFYTVLGFLSDPDFVVSGGDFTDPQRGFDLIFTYKKGAGAATYSNMHLARNPSPVIVKGWQRSLKNLDTFQRAKTRQELMAILAGEGE